MQAQVYKCLNK